MCKIFQAKTWKDNYIYMFGLCSLTLFGIIFITLTHLCSTTDDKISRVENKQIQIENHSITDDEDTCNNFSNCLTDCEMTLNELNDMINKQDCRTFKNVLLNGIKFPNKILSQNWLTTNITVENSLKIIKPDITSIKNDAFNTEQFEGLAELNLYTLRIQDVRRDMFRGLPRMISFNIQNNLGLTHFIEKGLLNDFTSLEILQVLNVMVNDDSILNLTGHGNKLLFKLVTIDFRYNKLLTNLPGDAFWIAPNVIQIYLEGCSLNTIDVHAFRNLNKLIRINIKENRFQILHFIWFPNYVYLSDFYVQNNRFNCSCEMEWMIQKNRTIKNDFDATSCYRDNRWEILSNFLRYCEDGSTSLTDKSTEATTSHLSITPTTPGTRPSTSPSTTAASTPSTPWTTSTAPWTTSTTTSWTISSTTSPTTPATTLTTTPWTTSVTTPGTTSTTTPSTTSTTTPCTPSTTTPGTTSTTTPSTTSKATPSTTSSTTTSTTSSTPTSTPLPNILTIPCDHSLNTTIFQPSAVKLDIKYVDYKIIEIKLENSKDYVILSRNSNGQENPSCISDKIDDHLSGSLTISSLKEDTAYIFCVKHKNHPMFSIQDCYATKTLPIPENQPYLLNKQKSNLVLLVIGIVVVFVFATNTSLYMLLRKYPKLLRNNNIVVIEPPEETFQPRIFPTYLSTFHTLNHFERKPRKNPMYLSPISLRKKWRFDSPNNSARNTLASYVTVIEPTEYHPTNWNNDLYTYSLPPMVPPRPFFPRRKLRINQDFKPNMY